MFGGRCIIQLASILQAYYAAIFALSQNGYKRFSSVLHLDNANDLTACTLTVVQFALSRAAIILFEILLVVISLVDMNSLTLPVARNVTPKYLY